MPYFFYKVRWYLGVALLLCLAITVMKYSAWIDRKLFGNSSPSTASSQASPQVGVPAAGAASAGSASPSASQPTSVSDIRAQLTKAQSLLEDASSSVSDALKQLTTWQSEVTPLTSQAVDDEPSHQKTKLYDRLAYVMRSERPGAAELRDAAQRVEALSADVAGRLQQASPAPLTTLELAEVGDLHETCRDAAGDWARAVEQALAIKHLLVVADNEPADEATPATVADKLADADARAALAALDEEIQREKEEEARRREREEEREEAQQRQAEQDAKRLAEATSPEVKALLAPFMEPRNVQPRLSGATVKLTPTVDEAPMSLKALYGIGALTDSVDGLKRLAILGGHRKLSAPRWSVHSQPGNWTADDKEMLREAQQVLRDYGPTLVEAGLLSE